MKLSSAVLGFELWVACSDLTQNTRDVCDVYLKLFVSYVGPDVDALSGAY